MKHMTLAASRRFEVYGRSTRKAEFLARMEVLVPWVDSCAPSEPHYAEPGSGRPPVGLERRLRMCFVANWLNLAGETCEDELYDIVVFRDFCRIDPGCERVCSST
jgi:IS5 family transposase